MVKLYSYILVLMSLTTVGNWLSIQWWAPNLTIDVMERCLYFVVLLYPVFKFRHFQIVKKEKTFAVFNVFVYYTVALSVYALANYANRGERSDLAELMNYNMGMITCFCVYTFAQPHWFSLACRHLYKFLPLIAIVYLPMARDGAYGDLMGFLCLPAILLLLFFDELPKKQKAIWLLLTIIIVVTSFVGDARSNVIKYTIALLIGLTFSHEMIYRKLKHLVWICVILPFVLLYLGIIGTFNIFETDQYIKNKSISEGTISDTRTLVYVETISSAVNNDYILFGRGIGRGYESNFQERRSMDSKTATAISSSERNSEVGMHNIFSWGGIVYVVIYTLMWCSVLYYGVYKSRNKYVRAVGFYLAFYYFYSWVENSPSFSAMYISSWLMVAICLSPYFRNMDDIKFKHFMRVLCANAKSLQQSTDRIKTEGSRHIMNRHSS